jgi:hypothetical protein
LPSWWPYCVPTLDTSAIWLIIWEQHDRGQMGMCVTCEKSENVHSTFF